MSNPYSIVAIVGRPNVGKSTLFNRLVGRRSAIVEKKPGVTRDRNYGISKYHGYEFIAIDTGGFEPVAESLLRKQMVQQARLAVEEADCVLFVVNAQEGWTPADGEIYRTLVEAETRLFVVVNKADNPRLEEESTDFYQLGVEIIYPVSAEHNRGIDGLLEEVDQLVSLKMEEKRDSTEEADRSKEPIAVAVIGKPNAGKSSIVNALLRKERMIVDSVSGTTRDPVDSHCSYEGREYLLVDTAGIRRRGKVSQKIETFSIVSALKSIERADVTLLIIDAEEGITEQVMKIAGYANERKKSLLIVMNKWDLVKKDGTTLKQVEEEVYDRLGFISFAPILFVSAKTGLRVPQIFEKILSVHGQYVRRIQTSDLNTILQLIVNQHPPPSKSGRPTKVYYGNQVSVAPPTFVFMTNNPEKTNFAYERYIANQFRYHFGFEGTPLNFIWRKKKSARSNNAGKKSWKI
ncbi:MAG: ribosome biogenesis GTPase Der [Deltaproteobacteria bacterium]|jgi:GTP-binding protein|uniref:GTPase Der n=1 Tax=marine metagenome TaxID=408172 RepID=A0A381NPA1_9ZZZZ|nr:ribosome biogenesis GTPase Der [Deltaproteobacteria bacterium]MDP6309159.1 ribosome biogenesis GTPase Der [SAR324 cluster bacterium]MDP6486734.1 ribosome biogenesis GTPase Der [SAR324 cluster bacterium]MDP7170014.1 ribosome biogenesis GTPase Der [SAR324 cluster bacterium]MDP7438410.1 ribosome biogenesis GTPase Der [SAR324 cluster bacterium]|tara:strand:- start:4461 stop:5846 length:1386 start_codon:yes stop_codon:yes gene_type:complete